MFSLQFAMGNCCQLLLGKEESRPSSQLRLTGAWYHARSGVLIVFNGRAGTHTGASPPARKLKCYDRCYCICLALTPACTDGVWQGPRDLAHDTLVAFQSAGFDAIQWCLVDCPGHASLIRTVIGWSWAGIGSSCAFVRSRCVR